MRITKKMLLIVLSFILVVSFVGCSFAASFAVLPLTFTNGDEITVNMKSGEYNWKLNYDEDDNLLYATESDEDVVVCSFRTEEQIGQYIEIIAQVRANESQNFEFIGNGEINGLRYTMASFEDDNGNPVYEVIGWIVGSNLGIVMDCYESEEYFIDFLNSVTFEVSATEQADSNFCYEDIDNIESVVE